MHFLDGATAKKMAKVPGGVYLSRLFTKYIVPLPISAIYFNILNQQIPLFE
jgi:hypothetical protein